MIPEEWELRTLQDCGITVIDGDRGKEYPSSDDFFDEGYCLFLSAKNVTKAGFVFDNCQFINETKHKQLRKGSVQPGDLVLTTRGTVGNVGYLRDLNGFGAVRINSGMVVVRNSQKCIETDFLHALFRSPVVEKQIERMNFGSAQPQLTVKIVNSLKLPIPPVRERQRITGALETWDRAIVTVEALIANARAQKQALMQQLLTGKRRLPGFDAPWRERSLESVFQFKKGQGLSKEAVTPDGVRPCILYGELYTRYPEVIREVVGRTNANDGFPSMAGDVLIPASTTTTGIDLANATAILEGDVLLSGDINILRPKDTKQSAPFFAYLLTHNLKQKIASRAQGITIVHLYGAHLKPLTVFVPEAQEQHAIASIIMEADDEILRLEAQLTALRQEKAALMQQLLTGKRRVKLPESEVA